MDIRIRKLENRREEPEPDVPTTSRRSPAILIVTLAILAASAGISSYYFYSKLNKLEQYQRPAEQNKEDIVRQAGKLILLPGGEEPSIAEVTDPVRLSDQPFFANAEVGDQVLIYRIARKAILYRPSINKIIEVSALNPETATSSQQ